MRTRGLAATSALALIAAAAATTGTARAAEACKPIAGADHVLQKPDLRWLVVGEVHGTAELPDAFADLVCLAAARGRPVVVGLEFPPDEQARFDAYMASTGDAAAQAALLDGAAWRQSLRDGRSSRAMLALVERLRRMKAAGQVERLVAIRNQPRLVPEQGYDPALGEAAIAQGMREAASGDGLAVILVGNIHAATRRFRNMAYDPAAALLPAERTITLNFDYAGGTAWTCLAPAAGEGLKCQGNSMGPPREPGQRRIEPAGKVDLPWSGIFFLGAPVTASPPAVPEAVAAALR